MTRIAYIVHDLNDAAVVRRVTMLRAVGASVAVAGFRRGAVAPSDVGGAAATDLGATADARLGQRAIAVIRQVVRPGMLAPFVARADVIMARNLEALALAVRVRKPGQRLVYECLDIHRTLTGTSLAHRAVQTIEARLLRSVDLVIVSSPAFVTHHFARLPTLRVPTLLVENKLLALAWQPTLMPPPAGPPWTIGWFGMLRCRRTLTILGEIARKLDGRVEILIAGKPSVAEFDDFPAAVAAIPHCRYVGPYGPDDLPKLYRQCHFAWAIDYFEEGLNSSWLLPNRLYEAAVFGSVPIARADVETGHWLSRYDAGLRLEAGDPVEQLAAVLDGIDPDGYRAMRERVATIPRDALIANEVDCRALLGAIAGP